MAIMKDKIATDPIKLYSKNITSLLSLIALFVTKGNIDLAKELLKDFSDNEME